MFVHRCSWNERLLKPPRSLTICCKPDMCTSIAWSLLAEDCHVGVSGDLCRAQIIGGQRAHKKHDQLVVFSKTVEAEWNDDALSRVSYQALGTSQ